MPGKRGPEFGDFVTPFEAYRVNISAADGSGPTDDAIPVLDTRQGPNQNVMGQGSDKSQYGRNAQIDIAAIIKGFTSVTLQLWMKAEPDRAELRAPPGSSSSSASPIEEPTTGLWVKVDEKVLTASGWWVIKDIPPAQYKVLASAVSGTGAVSIVECHAA
jgi:hypothetical protein